MIALCLTDGDRQDGCVSPKLPAPPEPPRPRTISVRLSDAEFAQLERVQELLGKHWHRKTEKAEALRAALAMLSEELEAQLGRKAPAKSAKP